MSPKVSSASPTIYIVEDDESLRAALEELFQSVGHGTAAYGSANAFLEAFSADAPGCLVMDVRLPGTSGLDFQGRMEALGVHLPVILMSGHGDIPMSVRGMKAGAVDFLTKPFRDQDMLDAADEALARDRERRARTSDADRVRALHASLSPREQQVMALVTAGLLNKQVAGKLQISEVTVKIHRGAVMRKMGARTLADLVRLADLVLGAQRTATNTSV